jgi:hypothetical protein
MQTSGECYGLARSILQGYKENFVSLFTKSILFSVYGVFYSLLAN